MKVAFVTNLRAPYRTLQLNEFSNLHNVELTAFYTDPPMHNRDWNLNCEVHYTEFDLRGIKVSSKYGYINKNLIKIVREFDVIVLGCYEQPTYIVLSILCRIFRKNYILSFDGICTDRVEMKENKIKKYLKSIVINNASFILGNGEVSKKYFTNKFNFPSDKIYNQYLTVDSEKINELYDSKEIFRTKLRKELNISLKEKVLIFSGRLIEIKNIKIVIEALSLLNKTNITFVLLGGGELEDQLMEMAKKYNVKVVITGFIAEQEELFKHYFIGDALILPSIYDVWGLVVNEAMFAGLPVLVSSVCGCSLDLVQDSINGYIINPIDRDDIAHKIYNVLYSNKDFGKESRRIIKNWTFSSSANNFKKILEKL